MKKTLFTGLILLLSLAKINAQTISTIAGNGTAGNTGNGSPATAAELNVPFGVCTDSLGNVYIADDYNNQIRMVNTSGVISLFAGTGAGGYSGDGGQATLAKLNQPSQVYAAKNGNVYISDEFTNTIRMVNTSGVISTVAGTGIGGYSGDGGQATAAKVNTPTDVTFDAAGNMYIGDFSNARVRKVNTSGVISTIAGTGAAGYSGDGGLATAAEINHPYGVATDRQGNLFISDDIDNRIRMVNSVGVISTYAGTGVGGYSGDGGPATAAQISGPYKVNTDANGSVYIADRLNARIRWINKYTGIITTIAGTGAGGYNGDGIPATTAELGEAGGVFADNRTQAVYIADDLNNRVRKFGFAPMGVNSLLDNEMNVKVYPNPSNGLFTLEMKNTTNSLVQVFNALGQRVYYAKVQAGSLNTSIDLVNQPNGIYLYTIITEAGRYISSGKLIIN
jgi:hypothetical protein